MTGYSLQFKLVLGWVLWLIGMTALPCRALELEQVKTRFQEGEYRLTLTAVLSAPPPQVESVLRDYVRYPQLDRRILAAQVLARPAPTQVELLTRIDVCFAFWCREVKRVERVEEGPNELLATVIAERSDVRGSTHTQLSAQPCGQTLCTRVVYSTQIVPKFWVPALLGRSLMLRNLREATINLFESVEQRAAAGARP
ncbi:MAG: hypothetical protein QM808_11270 [Steroidobacteraceae bacterium]